MEKMKPAIANKFLTLKSTIGREKEYQQEVQPRLYADKILTMIDWDKEFEKHELEQTKRAKERLKLIELYKMSTKKENWNRFGELDNVFDSLGNFMGRFIKSQTSNSTGEEISGFSFRDLNLNAYDREDYDRKKYSREQVPRSEGEERRQDLFDNFCGSQLEERAKKRERKRTNRNKRTNRVESCKKKQKVSHDERQKKCWFDPIAELVFPVIRRDKRYWCVLYPPIHPLDVDVISDDESNLWQQDPEIEVMEHKHGHLWGAGIFD